MNTDKIQSFFVKNLWDEKEVRWDNINPDMNILVGINGSGKTTLANLMYAYYRDPKTLGKIRHSEAVGTPDASQLSGIEMAYVRNLDVPTRRKEESPLLLELENAVYQNKSNTSLFSYRMKMIDYPERFVTTHSPSMFGRGWGDKVIYMEDLIVDN